MGLPLEPLTAHDIGQAAGEKDHRHDQKKDIEHVKFLPLNMAFDAMVRSKLYCSARQVKSSSKEAAAVSRLRKKWLFPLSIPSGPSSPTPIGQAYHRCGSGLTGASVDRVPMVKSAPVEKTW
jgi:hypothetical protein